MNGNRSGKSSICSKHAATRDIAPDALGRVKEAIVVLRGCGTAVGTCDSKACSSTCVIRFSLKFESCVELKQAIALR